MASEMGLMRIGKTNGNLHLHGWPVSTKRHMVRTRSGSSVSRLQQHQSRSVGQ
jgi:hypothetical protein